jgi:hypothetical protein
MNMLRNIDITFDFRSDTPPEKDPDVDSPTLRRYHKLLWSKPLPSGELFVLDDTTPRAYAYLHHRSEVGEFFLSSDTVIPDFSREKKFAHIIDQVPAKELNSFITISYTIGGMMIFPGKQINRKMTINQQRGCHPWIKDRFDFTVECIRRYYLNESSPLSDTLVRYADFFELFGDFRGYVEFFLLQDLVAEDYCAVKFFTPFEDFNTSSPLPGSMDDYREYQQLAVEFIEARNRRILESC